jgi:hypothetical protein
MMPLAAMLRPLQRQHGFIRGKDLRKRSAVNPPGPVSSPPEAAQLSTSSRQLHAGMHGPVNWEPPRNASAACTSTVSCCLFHERCTAAWR